MRDHADPQTTPLPILDAALAATGSGAAHVGISRTGTIAYLPRIATDARAPIAWMDRGGRVTSVWQTPIDWRSPQFSPDGRRLAVAATDGRQFDVWVGQWASDDGLSRLTFEGADDFKPVWAPEGRDLAFASSRSGSANLYSDACRRWRNAAAADHQCECTGAGVVASNWGVSRLPGKSTRDWSGHHDFAGEA